MSGANIYAFTFSTESWIRILRSYNMFVGTPDDIIQRLQAFADAGAEELMLQWLGVDDIEGLQVLAEHVLPHLVA